MSTPNSSRDAAIDVALVLVAISAAWALSRFALYPALSVPDNAPLILRPISGFLVATWLVRRRGQRWRDFGLSRPSWLRAVLGAVALYGALMAVSRWVVPLLAAWLGTSHQPSFMGYIHGKLVPTLGWLAIGWLVGGFAEELLFRGFLLRRTAEALGGGPWGQAVGVAGQALLFGSLHWYGGAFAFVHAGVFALVMGLFYLVAGRNLWPLIVVHGLWNTLGIWSVYAG
jgi:membrane protease YdiL (CAAX protease family)